MGGASRGADMYPWVCSVQGAGGDPVLSYRLGLSQEWRGLDVAYLLSVLCLLSFLFCPDTHIHAQPSIPGMPGWGAE